jgi:hypothetical protein
MERAGHHLLTAALLALAKEAEGDPPIIAARSATQARSLAEIQLARRPDYVKAWFIHGRRDDLQAQTTVVKAAGDAAHAAGVPFAVHATELAVAKAALRAGADYLVHSVEDQPVDDEFIERTAARVPAVAIDWTSMAKERAGNNAGQLSKCDFSFLIWIIDENLRGDMTASRGSEVVAEAARSPGAYAIGGDISDLLDGALGEQLGEQGITICRTGNLSIVEKKQKGRRVILALELGVWATISRSGSNAITMAGLDTQMQDAAARSSTAVDPDNVLISGLRISVGSGLSRAPSNGSAKVGGTTVAVTGAALHTFDAWSDTYRDLADDGTITYTAVPIDAEPPAQADGTLRLGCTRTDSAGATRDVLLAPLLRDTGPVITIAP